MQEINAEILIERVWSYAEKIRSGEIKASKKHRWAVERFFEMLNDLQMMTALIILMPRLLSIFMNGQGNSDTSRGFLPDSQLNLQTFSFL